MPWLLGTFQPPHYAAGHIEIQHLFAGLRGHLLSPSRSFFIFWPALPLVLWMLWRLREGVIGARWLAAAAVAFAAQIWIHSAHGHWWGGGSYGSRYTHGTVPWYFTAAVIAVAAEWGKCGIATKAVAAALCSVAVLIHARGALSQATQDWYAGIDDGNAHRLWDWREPQFLAGLVPRPVPESAPDIRAVGPTTDPAFAQGRTAPEEDRLRWNRSALAEIQLFALPGLSGTCILDVAPYLGGGKIPSQRVTAKLGRETILNTTLTGPKRQEVRITLDALHATNRLTFLLPDVASPLQVEPGSSGTRPLALQLFGIRPEPAR